MIMKIEGTKTWEGCTRQTILDSVRRDVKLIIAEGCDAHPEGGCPRPIFAKFAITLVEIAFQGQDLALVATTPEHHFLTMMFSMLNYALDSHAILDAFRHNTQAHKVAVETMTTLGALQAGHTDRIIEEVMDLFGMDKGTDG